jgi:hypothetical protein
MRLALLCLMFGISANAASWYVSTNGTDVAAGTLSDPLSVTKAIGATSPAAPGDTVWLRGGTYTNAFVSALSGTSNAPIVLRNYNGERVIFNSTNQSQLNGSGTWLWGMEFTDSATNRDVVRSSGVIFNSGSAGHANKLINCILHDLGNSVFVSYQSTNAEVTGCVIYNNGYILPDRAHGHGLYVQNREHDQQQHYRENIILNNFSKGINARSSFKVVNQRFTRNVLFGNETPFHTESDDIYTDMLVFDGNLLYKASADYASFYGFRTTGDGTIILSNNVFGNTHTHALWWTNVIFNANTQFYALQVRPQTITPNTNFTTADYNTYYKVQWDWPIQYYQTNITLDQWRSVHGNDLNGTATADAPTGTWAYIHRNPYESNRANVTIYNWGLSNNVAVDLSAVLAVGASYTVKHAPDFMGASVLSGTYAGGTVSFPMTNLNVAIPVGRETAPTSTGPEFAAFVVMPTSEAPPIEPPAQPTGTLRANKLVVR